MTDTRTLAALRRGHRVMTSDVVDASVVTVALACGAIVFTTDPDGINRLATASDVKPGLVIRRV